MDEKEQCEKELLIPGLGLLHISASCYLLQARAGIRSLHSITSCNPKKWVLWPLSTYTQLDSLVQAEG